MQPKKWRSFSKFFFHFCALLEFIIAINTYLHNILTHDNPWSNVASVLCIAGLFAIRRFLIPKGEMTIELSEVEEDAEETVAP